MTRALHETLKNERRQSSLYEKARDLRVDSLTKARDAIDKTRFEIWVMDQMFADIEQQVDRLGSDHPQARELIETAARIGVRLSSLTTKLLRIREWLLKENAPRTADEEMLYNIATETVRSRRT